MNILKALFVTLTLFFAPVVPLVIMVLFAIAIDTLFGVIASYKTGKEIQSRKLARIVTKSIVYISLILLTYGIDFNLINSILFSKLGISWAITKGAAVIIVIIEGFSIDEKIRMFNDEKGIWYYIKLIVTRFKALAKQAHSIKDDVDKLK